MSLESYISFVAASALLILAPGPMVALIVANAAGAGLRAGLTTVAGAACGLAIHLGAVCLGLAAALAALGEAAFWLKWAGAAYLFHLGVAALRAPAPALGAAGGPEAPRRRIFVEALLVQLVNPKVLIFYAAFFPLFLDPAKPAAPQLFLMCATFLLIEIVLDSAWAAGATQARPLVKRAGRSGNRVSGGVLIAAAAGVALMKKS
jgi:threonine/homoserine/homoserine lactone efflux protein